MTNQEIIDRTKEYFCFGIEEQDLIVRIDAARLLSPGSTVVDFGIGQARTSITMAMANPDIEIYAFDSGRIDMTNDQLMDRTLKRCQDQGVNNVHFSIGDAKLLFQDWKYPLGILSIDAEGSHEATKIEVEGWFPHVISGGTIFMQSYNLVYKYPDIKLIVDEYLVSHEEYKLDVLAHNTQVIKKL